MIIINVCMLAYHWLFVLYDAILVFGIICCLHMSIEMRNNVEILDCSMSKNCCNGHDYTSIFQASLLNCALLALSICLELCFCKLKKKDVLMSLLSSIVFRIVCLLLVFFLSIRSSVILCPAVNLFR